jgi:hypothetical protein
MIYFQVELLNLNLMNNFISLMEISYIQVIGDPFHKVI